MYVIKYDKLSMIKLVQCIEKYPAIYDNKNNFSKEEQDKAWDKVAIDVGEKDSLCRDRWHSIKSCYIRHLKYSALNSKRKPYYLAEFLDFMIPFVSDKIKTFITMRQFEMGTLPSYLKEALPARQTMRAFYNQSIPNRQVNTVVKTEIVDIDENSESEWLEISTDDQQPTSSKTVNKRAKPDSSLNSKKTKILQLNDGSRNQDESFLRSLLPDISRMSNHQKLKFKQEALSVIEDILYANDDVNVTT